MQHLSLACDKKPLEETKTTGPPSAKVVQKKVKKQDGEVFEEYQHQS